MFLNIYIYIYLSTVSQTKKTLNLSRPARGRRVDLLGGRPVDPLGGRRVDPLKGSQPSETPFQRGLTIYIFIYISILDSLEGRRGDPLGGRRVDLLGVGQSTPQGVGESAPWGVVNPQTCDNSKFPNREIAQTEAYIFCPPQTCQTFSFEIRLFFLCYPRL